MLKVQNFCRRKFIVSWLVALLLLTLVLYYRKYYKFNQHEKKKNQMNLQAKIYWDKNTSRYPIPDPSYKNAAIKIVFWTNPGNPLSADKTARLQKIVERMNAKSHESVCNYQFMDNEQQETITEDHCEFSMNSETVHVADVVVFFMFNYGYSLSELPTNFKRSSNQLWVMYAREPPPLSIWKNALLNMINWTMSYRSESDVWTPYGMKIPSTKNDQIFINGVNLNEWISRKSKLVTGVISRCRSDSRRETLISQLQKTEIAKVDIYGECGLPFCNRYSTNCTLFWKNLAKQYKFYLAFENSLCKDYITEKFWRALELGMVPVVYGSGNYKLEAPPYSYIDIQDFNSARDLMTYLKRLNKNAKEYAEYFEWRKYWDIRGNGGMNYDWCALCKTVSNYNKLPMKKSYENVQWWWQHQTNSTEPACSHPYSFTKS